MVRVLRCIANEVIQRSAAYFGEIGTLSGQAGNKWRMAKRILDRKRNEVENLEAGKSRLAEIISVCDVFRKLVSEGCFRTKPSTVSAAWNEIRPQGVCGRLDWLVERCRALQKALLDVLNLRQLSGIEMTGPNRRVLSAALSLISRDVSIVIDQFLAKAGGAPAALLDLNNSAIPMAIDVFGQSVLEFDQRLESYVKESVENSEDLFECATFVECLGALALRPSVERSLREKMAAIAQKLRTELDSVIILVEKGNTAQRSLDVGRSAAVNMPPVAGEVLWAQGMAKRVDSARASFDVLVGKFGSAESLAGTTTAIDITALCTECSKLSVRLAERITNALDGWSSGVRVSAEDLREPLLRRKLANPPSSLDEPIAEREGGGDGDDDDTSRYAHLQVVVNLPKAIVTFIREIKYLLAYGFDVKLPPALLSVFGNSDLLRQHTEMLENLVTIYNTLLENMAPEESAVLDRPHKDLQLLIAKSLIGNTKVPMNWRSHGIHAFITRMNSAVRSLASGLETLHDNIEFINMKIVKWRDFPLFDRKVPHSPLHEGLELHAEDTRKRVDGALSDLRTLLGEGLKGVSDKLKISANKVGVNTTSPEWRQYACCCDQAVQAGIVNAYSKTLNDLHKSLSGGTTPVMEVKLELSAGIVHFTPFSFGTATSASTRKQGIIRMWAAATNEVYGSAFQSTARGTSAEAFGASSDVVRQLVAIEQAETECADQRAEFLKQFLSFTELWEDNMNSEFRAFMRDSGEHTRQVAAGATSDRDYFPSLHKFEAQIHRYREMGRQVGDLPSFTMVTWLRVDARPIKQAMTSWAAKWSNMYETFLADSVNAQLKATRVFAADVESDLGLEVITDDDIVTVMLAIQHVEAGSSAISAVFRPVQDALAMLEGLGVPLGDKVSSLARNTELRWDMVMQKCEDAKSQYGAQIKARFRLVAQACSDLTLEMRQWQRQFKKVAPSTFRVAPASTLGSSAATADDERHRVALHVGLAAYDHRAKQYLLAYAELRDVNATVSDFGKRFQTLTEETVKFQLPPPDAEVLQECRRDMLRLKKSWDMVSMITLTIDRWSSLNWADNRESSIESMRETVKSLAVMATSPPLNEWPGFASVAPWVKAFGVALEVVEPVSKSRAILVRHWRSLTKRVPWAGVSPGKEIVRYCEQPTMALKLSDVLSLQPHPLWCATEFENMLATAEGEYELDLKLAMIGRHYEELELKVDRADSQTDPMGTPPTLAQMYKIQDLEPVFTELGEHQTDVSAMQFSKHLEFFKTTVVLWSQRFRAMVTQLTLMTELGASIEAMGKWFFVEPRVRLDLEDEGRMFELLFFRWQRLLREVEEQPNVQMACSESDRMDVIRQMQQSAEVCNKALQGWVECIRSGFPRLYFLSHSEVLAATVRSTPTCSVPFLPKLFAGVRGFRFSVDSIISVSSAGTSTLNLGHPVSFKDDFWLANLLREIQLTIQKLLMISMVLRDQQEAKTMVDAQETDSQIVVLKASVLFTRDVETAFQASASGDDSALTVLSTRYSNRMKILARNLQDNNFTDAVDQQATKTRMMYGLRHRDMINALAYPAEGAAAAESDWLWQSQLRYYHSVETDGELSVQLLRGSYDYSFEMLPIGAFYEPMTDRSFVTMAMAVASVHGNTISGPTASGKTENVTVLGHCLGRMVYTLSCHDEMHPETLASLFKGIAHAGVWCCFDGLSESAGKTKTTALVAHYLGRFLTGLRERAATFDVDGQGIPLSPHGAFFIACTSAVPKHMPITEELRGWLRPTSVQPPDLGVICEFMLTASGYENHQTVGARLAVLFQLCADCLCDAQYDWSARALCKVLNACDAGSDQAGLEMESEHVARVFMASILPRLHPSDKPVLYGLVVDVLCFEGNVTAGELSESPTDLESDETITRGVDKYCDLARIQASAGLAAKAIQLDSMMRRSAAVVLVGDAGRGKSTLWRALATANSVNFEVLCPAIVRGEMLHAKSDAHRNQSDGALTRILRKMVTAAQLDHHHKWVVLDGSVESEWVEAMHGIMEESNQFHLPNTNETLLLEGTIQLVFECDSLQNASPATISRLEIMAVGLHEDGPTWQLAANSWLSTLRSPAIQSNFRELFDTYLAALVEKTEHAQPSVKAAGLAAVETLFSLLNALLLKPDMDLTETVGGSLDSPIFSPFLVSDASERTDSERMEAVFNFAVVWAFGGSLVLPSEQLEFGQWWRALWQGAAMPDNDGSVFDFYLDEQGNFVDWTRFVTNPLKGSSIDLRSYCIPNATSTRTFILHELLLQQDHPVMLIGNRGAGKTRILRNLASVLHHNSFVYTPCNLATTSARLAETFLSRLSLGTGTLQPKYSTENEVIFIVDDVNAPSPDVYGGQSVGELLRHLREHKQIQIDGENTPVRGVQLVAAMGTEAVPGVNRNDRLLRHFATIAMTPPSNEQDLISLFGTIVPRRFTSVGAKRTVASLVHATSALHCEMVALIPSLPGSSITSVLHGICRVEDYSRVTRSVLLVQLWMYECKRTYRDRLEFEDTKTYDAALVQICKRCLDSNQNLPRARQVSLFVPTTDIGDSPDRSLVAMAADEVRKLVQGCISESKREHDFGWQIDHGDTLVMEALEHICRVARNLSVPGGHMIIMGQRESGKKTVTILGARICGYQHIVNLSDAASTGEEGFKAVLKKACITAALISKAGLACYLSGELPEYALGLIDSVVGTGTVDGSFDADDSRQILTAMQKELSEKGQVVGPQECWAHFHLKARQKLHFVIIGSLKIALLERFPALWGASGLNNMPRWSNQSLYEMASGLIRSSVLGLNMAQEEAVAQSFAWGHWASVEASQSLLESHGRFVSIAPNALRDCIKLCEHLVLRRRRQAAESNQTIHVVLSSLSRLENTVIESLKQKHVGAELNEQAKITAVDEIIEKVSLEADRLAEQSAASKTHMALVEPLVTKVNEAKFHCDTLQLQVEAVTSSINGCLAEITKMGLAEMAAPVRQKPDVANAVAGVVLLMTTTDERPDLSWKSVKAVISEGEFRMAMAKFDLNRVQQTSIRTVQKYLDDPHFNPDYLRNKCKSKPAATFCNWVRAVVDHFRLSSELAMSTDLLAKAEQAAGSSVAKRDQMQAYVASISERVQVLKREFDFVSREKIAAAELVGEIAARIVVAEHIVRCVSEPATAWQRRGEVYKPVDLTAEDVDIDRVRFNRFDSDGTGDLERPEIHAMMTEMGIECEPDYLNAVLAKFDLDGDGSVGFDEFKMMWALIEDQATSTSTAPAEAPADFTVGDCMMAAVQTNYLAAFGPSELRGQLRDRWLAELDHRGVPYSRDADWLTIVEARPLTWVRHGLPSDALAVENAAAAMSSNRFPLLLDSEDQAETWLAEMFSVTGLRVAHCQDSDIVSQVARWDMTPLVVEMEEGLDPDELSELLRALLLNAKHAADKAIETTSHTHVFLHYRGDNPQVPDQIARMCTTVWFASSPVAIEEQILSEVVCMSCADGTRSPLSSITVNPELKVKEMHYIQDEALDKLLKVMLEFEPDNEKLLASDNETVVDISTAAEEWRDAMDQHDTTCNDAEAHQRIRSGYGPLANQMGRLYTCWQQMSKLGCPTGDAASFTHVVCRAVSDCWSEPDSAPTKEGVASACTDSMLQWVLTDLDLSDRRKLIGLICMREATPDDSTEMLLSPQLQPEAFSAPLHDLVVTRYGEDMAKRLGVATVAGSHLKLCNVFRGNLERALERCYSQLAPGEMSVAEERMLRCCWLHSVLALRASLSQQGAFCEHDLDAVLGAVREYASDGDETAAQLVCSIYCAKLQSRWDRRTCEAYVHEILAADEGSRLTLPNLPLSLAANSELQRAVESGGSVAAACLEQMTLDRELDSLTGIARVLGLNDSMLRPVQSEAGRSSLDAWWKINGISPPHVDSAESRLTAKSTLDDLIEGLPPPPPVIAATLWRHGPQDPWFPLAEAVRRETARFERVHERAARSLQELDEALEAASGPAAPPMNAHLQQLTEEFAQYTVPEDWFHDAASDQREARVPFVLPLAGATVATKGATSRRSVREWTEMMQDGLAQIKAWQNALSVKTSNSGLVTTIGELPTRVSLREVFRPQEFLAAARQAIAREQGWAVDGTVWSVAVDDTPADEALRDSMVVDGLHLHGAEWNETEGLHATANADAHADEGGGDRKRHETHASFEMPTLRLTLMQRDQDAGAAEPAGGAATYECPVFKQGAEGECVFTFKLRTSENPRLWEVRGVRALV